MFAFSRPCVRRSPFPLYLFLVFVVTTVASQAQERTAVVIGLGDSHVGGYAADVSQSILPRNPFGVDDDVTVWGAWSDRAARYDPAVTPARDWVVVDDRSNLSGLGACAMYPIASTVKRRYAAAGRPVPDHVRVVWLSVDATATALPGPSTPWTWSTQASENTWELFVEAHLRPAIETMLAAGEECELFGIFMSLGGLHARADQDPLQLLGIPTDLASIMDVLSSVLGIPENELPIFLYEFHVDRSPAWPYADDVRLQQYLWTATRPNFHLLPRNPLWPTVDGVHYGHDGVLQQGLDAAVSAFTRSRLPTIEYRPPN